MTRTPQRSKSKKAVRSLTVFKADLWAAFFISPMNVTLTAGRTEYLTVTDEVERGFTIKKIDAQNRASLQGAGSTQILRVFFIWFRGTHSAG